MYRYLLAMLACLAVVISLPLAGCKRGGPKFDKSTNPLPGYIEDYDKHYNKVQMHYCRFFNSQTKRSFQGVGQTKAEALKMAHTLCVTRSTNRAYCEKKAVVKCGKRQQLELIKALEKRGGEADLPLNEKGKTKND